MDVFLLLFLNIGCYNDKLPLSLTFKFSEDIYESNIFELDMCIIAVLMKLVKRSIIMKPEKTECWL